MKVLITGASGNLGRATAKQLAVDGHELVYVSRTAPQNAPEAKQYAVDMAESEQLTDIFNKEKPNVVIHLAAMLGPVCDQQPGLAQKVNVDATRRLAELSVKNNVKTFIFPSTAAVYNQQELQATNEDSNVEPRSMYGKTKLAAEQALSEVSKIGDTHFVALRIFNVYGEGFAMSLVNKLAEATTDTPVSLFSMDTFYRDYIHVKDIVTLFNNLCQKQDLAPFAVYNVAGGKATNNTELIALLRSQGYAPQFTVQDASPSYSWADISRAKNELDFSPAPSIVL
jgi:UDP-glucose 4-epimerase